MKYKVLSIPLFFKSQLMTTTVSNRRLRTLFTVVGLLLMIPLIAMGFTNEVRWGLFDFIIAGILLSGTALAIEFILRKFKSKTQRVIVCGIVLVLLLLVWAELAVGIFGTPFAGN